jgi:uncharacterized membrane protein YcaP (DUF421 family)
MEHKQIFLSDWHRLLLGGTPWTFLIEVLARAGFTYLLLMFAMRLLGRRVAGQYSLFELSVVITVAGTVGVPLQSPERGMLPPLIILGMLILMQRALAFFANKSRYVEGFTSGDVSLVVSDGCLRLEQLRHAVMSRERLFGLLRQRGIQHLGQIGRLYIEPSGGLSLIAASRPRPGLSILPAIDQELREEPQVKDHFSCASCGTTEPTPTKPAGQCRCCGSNRWEPAVTELDETPGSDRHAA